MTWTQMLSGVYVNGDRVITAVPPARVKDWSDILAEAIENWLSAQGEHEWQRS